MAFKPIETQEDLDIIIGERLKRDREATEKKYAGFAEAVEKAEKYDKLAAQDLEGQIAALNAQLKAEKEKNSGYDKTVADLTARAETAEASMLKTKIAIDAGLPFALADRLKGANEDELKKDAESFAGYLKPTSAPPLRSTEPTQAAASGGAQTSQAATFAAFQALNAALSDPQS